MNQTLIYVKVLILVIGFSFANAQQNLIPPVIVSSAQNNGEVISAVRDLKLESYPEIGILSSLQLFSPALGYWFGPYGVRVSGMYSNEELYELHLNLGFKRLDNVKKQRSINILLSRVVGFDPGADYDFTSLGIAYSWNSLFGVRGLFVEFGMAKVLDDNLGNVKDEFLVPCGYFGYMYRFIPK